MPPEKPKPTKSARSAKPTVVTKKSDSATPEHQELLEWLVRHRSSFAFAFWGQTDEWFDEQTKKAVSDYADRNTYLLTSLENASKDSSAPAAYRTACNAKLKWARAFLKKNSPPPLPAPLSAMRPVEAKWSVQAEIFHSDQTTGLRSDHRAGFVDLSVHLETPQYLAVHCFDHNQIDSIFNNTSGYDQCATAAEKLTFFAPTWSVERLSTYHAASLTRVWYDVWASLPSISYLLQHLKSLHALNVQSKRLDFLEDGLTYHAIESISTVLVVPDISETAKAIIENEGFRVIRKAHFDKLI